MQQESASSISDKTYSMTEIHIMDHTFSKAIKEAVDPFEES